MTVMCPWRFQRTLAQASNAFNATGANATQILATSKSPTYFLIT